MFARAIVCLLVLFSSLAYAGGGDQDQVALAFQGRKLLEEKQAGFELKEVCSKPKSKKAMPICKSVLSRSLISFRSPSL